MFAGFINPFHYKMPKSQFNKGDRIKYVGSRYKDRTNHEAIITDSNNGDYTILWDDHSLNAIFWGTLEDFIAVGNEPYQENKIKEKPCKICSRKNDIGVNKCWWCIVENPCD